MSKKGRVVLAYSGGLDTSCAIKWLQDNYGMNVVALCADIGQGVKDLKAIEKKAVRLGCERVVVQDAKEKFCEEYLKPAIRANAMYEDQYPLFTALARPLIAELLVDAALACDADAVAHGSTGKGNDQVRFDVTFAALAPHLKIIAPVREWGMTREEEFEYAAKHNIPIPVTADNPYSVDENLWGKSTECGVLEDPWQSPPEDAYEWLPPVRKAPDKPQEVVLGFEKGVPVALDGKKMKFQELVATLNKTAARHAVGFIDMVENRLVGIKSRETYEAPAATVVLTAHRDLESLCLTKDLHRVKRNLETVYSDLIYNGLWFSELRSCLDAFMESTQTHVTGDVRVRLYKGKCQPMGRRAPKGLYQTKLATYDKGDAFDHGAAVGFIKLWGLPHQVNALSKGLTRKKKGAGKHGGKKK